MDFFIVYSRMVRRRQKKKETVVVDTSSAEDEVSLAILKSLEEQKRQNEEHLRHTKRLDRLLKCNCCKRIDIPKDGNCFFSAVSVHTNMTPQIIREGVCTELDVNRDRYEDFVDKVKYKDMIDQLNNIGTWNNQLADCLPAATSNFLQRKVKIFTSDFNCQVVNPDHIDKGNKPVLLAYMKIKGKKHYDAVVPENGMNYQ